VENGVGVGVGLVEVGGEVVVGEGQGLRWYNLCFL
jgi:hypothetical protein